MAPGADGVRAGGHHFRDRHGIHEADGAAASRGRSRGAGEGLASGRDDLWHSHGQVAGLGRTATPGMGSARRRCDRRPARLRAHGELSADAVAAVRALDLFRLPGRRRLYGARQIQARSILVHWWLLRCCPCASPSPWSRSRICSRTWPKCGGHRRSGIDHERRAGGRNPHNGLRLPIKGEVSFKDVRFRYSPGAPYALEEVSFTCRPARCSASWGAAARARRR